MTTIRPLTKAIAGWGFPLTMTRNLPGRLPGYGTITQFVPVRGLYSVSLSSSRHGAGSVSGCTSSGFANGFGRRLRSWRLLGRNCMSIV